MRYTPEFVDRFCLELGTAQPQKPARVDGLSKQRIVSSVRAQIDRWRREGHSLAAIATRFSELGVEMSAATLRTCLRRSKSTTGTTRAKPKVRSTGATKIPTPHRTAANATGTRPQTTVPAAPPGAAAKERPPHISAELQPPRPEHSGAQLESVLGADIPTPDTGSRKEAAAPTPDVPAPLPAQPIRHAEPAVAVPVARTTVGHEKPPYRSAIIIRPEKPLSAFKENSQ